jgi:GTP 3',8-cyclase
MLLDRHNRNHNYLRISLTTNCNLRCFYCMPDEDIQLPPPSHFMQPHEIESLTRIFVHLGVTKIRLTGGEPLVRKDAAAIIEKLGAFPVELAMTTNGIRLPEYIPVIKKAGIRSVNVSLDTLQKDKFLLLTKRDQYDVVKQNIELLLHQGIHVKVNVVVMKGVNEEEINDFISWTKFTPIHIRFIEFMPFTGNHWQADKVFGRQQILQTVASAYDWVKLKDQPHDTAKKYRVLGFTGTFAVISTITAPFCGDCNRMRLTADGKLKNCLFSKDETDLLTALRQGQDVEPLIRQCILNKAQERGGQFSAQPEDLDVRLMKNRSMIAIGG